MRGIVVGHRAYPRQPATTTGPRAVISSSTVLAPATCPNGKPAPDLFLHAAYAQWTVRGLATASSSRIRRPGYAAATTAGMAAVGFVGGSHAGALLGEQLMEAGARTIVADLRHLKSTVVALRGVGVSLRLLLALRRFLCALRGLLLVLRRRSRRIRHRPHRRRAPCLRGIGKVSPSSTSMNCTWV